MRARNQDSLRVLNALSASRLKSVVFAGSGTLSATSAQRLIGITAEIGIGSLIYLGHLACAQRLIGITAEIGPKLVISSMLWFGSAQRLIGITAEIGA